MMTKFRGWLVGGVVALVALIGCYTGGSSPSRTPASYSSAPSTSYHSTPAPPGKPLVAENGSYYGQTSDLTGRPKTVHVKGYYRKDGTYVRGHYRNKPRR